MTFVVSRADDDAEALALPDALELALLDGLVLLDALELLLELLQAETRIAAAATLTAATGTRLTRVDFMTLL